MRRWRQDGNVLYYEVAPATERFMVMPAGWRLGETHPALLWLAESVLRHEVFQPPASAMPPRRMPGHRMGLAFSGGRDSTAARLLLPPDSPCCYFRQTAAPDDRNPRQHIGPDRVFGAMPEVIQTPSDFHLAGQSFGRPAGWYNIGVPMLGLILLADYLDLRGVGHGNTYSTHLLAHLTELTLLDAPFGGTYANVCARFAHAGLEFVSLCGALTECCTERIVRAERVSPPTAICQRDCGACFKCWRKSLWDGPREMPPAAAAWWRRPTASALVTIRLLQRHDFCPPEALRYYHLDCEWEERWLAYGAARMLSEEWLAVVQRRMEQLGVEPLPSDLRPRTVYQRLKEIREDSR